MAEYSEHDFEHVELDPVILKDPEGVDHKFHFTVRHLGDRVAIEAFEIKEGQKGGYEFSHIGDLDEEIFNLFAKLVERILMGLHRKHIEWSDITRVGKLPKTTLCGEPSPVTLKVMMIMDIHR